MKKFTIMFLTVLLLSTPLIAQSPKDAPKVKFEKVSEEELSMKTYPNDTTAEAVILYDSGASYVRYEATAKASMLTHERFVRIKILKQKGVEWGTFRIALYSNWKNPETISSLKGFTFNLENGKIIKSELKKSDISKDQENKNEETVRLVMPFVKVGSVIDLQYKIYSELTWNIHPWKFQYSIPVKWSQYHIVYPEYFNYNHSSLGYHPLLYNKQSQGNESIQVMQKEERAEGGHDVNRGLVTYQTQEFDYAAKDVPALREEPFITSLNNYTTRVSFELANVNFAKNGGTVKNYTTSWNAIAKQLNDMANFGLQLKNNNFTDEAVKTTTKGAADEMKRLELIYHHLQQTMNWDHVNSFFTGKDLRKTYNDKSGNSADINLLLVAMLNKANVIAEPVILSTRTHGIISPTHPSLSDCNYVIVRALVDNKPILLDATEPNLEIGNIPFRCLNGEGHLITREGSEAVPLSNPKAIENSTVQLEIINGKITGQVQKQLFGQDAFDLRESIKSTGGKQEYINKFKNSLIDNELLDYEFENLDSLGLPVMINYKFARKETVDSNAGGIYINPILTERMKKNPFASPERFYPVDFGLPFIKLYNFQLTIPEGYTVDEVPQSKSYALPDNGGSFMYKVAKLGDKVSVSFRFSIDKTLFLPSEYEALKSLYDFLINKQSEQIILKKAHI